MKKTFVQFQKNLHKIGFAQISYPLSINFNSKNAWKMTKFRAILLIWFSVFACFGVRFCPVSPSVCLYVIYLGLGS